MQEYTFFIFKYMVIYILYIQYRDIYSTYSIQEYIFFIFNTGIYILYIKYRDIYSLYSNIQEYMFC